MHLLSRARWTRPHGKRVAPPNITWAMLIRPSRHDAASGRWRSAYTESLLIRAITMSIDASDNMLDPVMRRFALSLSDAANLVAYLKLLGSLPEPGVNERSIVVGIGLRPGDSAIRSVLVAYVDEINRRGDLFGRRLMLQVMEPNAGETFGSAVARLAAADTLFGLLAPVIAGDEVAAVAAMDAAGLPTVGPVTSRVRAALRSRYVFYLTGGTEAEGRALSSFAASTLGLPAIVADGSIVWQAAAQAAVTALTDAGPPPPSQCDLMTPVFRGHSPAVALCCGSPTAVSPGRPSPNWRAGRPRCCCPAPWRVICLSAARLRQPTSPSRAVPPTLHHKPQPNCAPSSRMTTLHPRTGRFRCGRPSIGPRNAWRWHR